MKRQIVRLFFWIGLFGFLSACPKPGPTPVPGPIPTDVFHGQIFDCTGLDTTASQSYAITCSDSSDMNTCLLGYYNTGVPLAMLACGARDAEMVVFVEVAKGDAGAEIRSQAATLRAWFANEDITLRSAP